jgi:hypothetical protein
VVVNPAFLEKEDPLDPDVPADPSRIYFINTTDKYFYFVDENDDPIPAAYGNSFEAIYKLVTLISLDDGSWILVGATA